MVKTKFEVTTKSWLWFTTKYDYDEIMLQLISSDLVEIMFVRFINFQSNTVDFKIKFDLINLLTKNVSEDWKNENFQRMFVCAKFGWGKNR